MKRMAVLLIMLSFSVLSLADAAKAVNLEEYGAGRVRFASGDGARLSFGKQEINVKSDYLVLLGSRFDTGSAMLEVVTLNGNEYWIGSDTMFHFEAMDSKGPETTMFLGKGSFVVQTRYPFTLTTGAGTVYFPAEGVYLVSKDAFGKDKLHIFTKAGTRPETVKKSTVFSRIKYTDDVHNSELMAWAEQRMIDWRKTQTRCNMFSHVDKMPPYMAVRAADGKLKWKKVETVAPIYRMDSIVDGNTFFYNPRMIHALGLWSPYSLYMTDVETALFFATNQYNSVRWAWDVANGWHAEWYYDPLAGFGAQYQYPHWNMFVYNHYWHYRYWWGPRAYHYLDDYYYRYTWLSPLYQRPARKLTRPDRPDGQVAYDSRIPATRGRTIHYVRSGDRPTLRRNTDASLITRAMAQRLSFDTREVQRATKRVELRRERSRLSTGSGTVAGPTSGRVTRTTTRTSTTVVTPTRSTTIPSTSGVRGGGTKVVRPPR